MQNDDELEARLRSARPEPGEELVSRLSSQAGTRRPPARAGLPVRLLLALVTVTAAFGSIFAFAAQPDGKSGAKATPAADQYEEKVTICHRPPGNPSNGQTLTLPRSAAEAHLRNHSGDTLGACPGRGVAGAVGGGGSGGGSAGTGTGGTGAAAGTAVDPGNGAGGSLAFTGLGLGVLASIGFVLLLGGWIARWRGMRTAQPG